MADVQCGSLSLITFFSGKIATKIDATLRGAAPNVNEYGTFI